ncbi:MAG: GWxTD domain-containing protein [Saprospiraceae bacterium]|nr:GWxTD domain-containing protein [Saprospiraceae bacterium]
MKKIIHTILFFSLSVQILFGLSLDVNSYVFNGDKSYLEVYLRLSGNSVTYVDDGLENKANVSFTLIIKNDELVVQYDKFTLSVSSLDSINDLLEIRRFYLSAGKYSLYILAEDTANPANKTELEQLINVDEFNTDWSLSDVQLLSVAREGKDGSPLIKHGIYMEPLGMSFADKSTDFLHFYCEIYSNVSVNAKEDFFLQYTLTEFIKESLTQKLIFSKFKKLKKDSIEPSLLPLSLKEIPSGDYTLTVAVINKERKVLAEKKVYFDRENPVADLALLENYNTDVQNSFVQKIPESELDFILKAHQPITEQKQMATLNEIIKKAQPRSQRQFIYQFWKKTAQDSPETSFQKYMEVARVVDKQFHSNVGYGFQSDRGYTFLKYGKPANVLTIDNEPDAPPYEIWYYNYIPTTQQTNVRFLFYNSSLVHNDFRLLHTNCYGERNNPAWETELYKSVPLERLGNAVDARQVGENWNRHARKYFNDY